MFYRVGGCVVASIRPASERTHKPAGGLSTQNVSGSEARTTGTGPAVEDFGFTKPKGAQWLWWWWWWWWWWWTRSSKPLIWKQQALWNPYPANKCAYVHVYMQLITCPHTTHLVGAVLGERGAKPFSLDQIGMRMFNKIFFSQSLFHFPTMSSDTSWHLKIFSQLPIIRLQVGT